MSEGMRESIAHASRDHLVVERIAAADEVAHKRNAPTPGRSFVWAFVLFVLAALVHASGRADEPLTQRDLHSHQLRAGLDCAPSLGVLVCLRLKEPLAAQRHRADVKRTGPELCLFVRSTRNTCLRDGSDIRYAFLERVSGYYVVVETRAAHGYTVLMVNEKTRRVRRVDNRPLVGPGGSFFATVSYDTDAAYVPNRVVIWSSTRNTPVYTRRKFAPGAGPIAIRWTARNRLAVHYGRADYSSSFDNETGTFGVWKDKTGVWRDNYAGH